MRRLICFIAMMLMSSIVFAQVKIQHWQHSSGAQIYLVNAPSIPMIDIQIDWLAGSAFDPPAQLGLASLTAGLIDKGAGRLDEVAISESLADLGASLSIGASNERASLRIRTLSDDARKKAVVDLAVQLLKGPSFDEKILRREQERLITAIREASLKPEVILNEAFDRKIYGDHPFARVATEKTIRSITPSHIQTFFKQRYIASNATMIFVGDIGQDQASVIADRLMAALPANSSAIFNVPPVSKLSATASDLKVQWIEHSSLQAHVMMGLPTISRNDPDYFPMLVGNYILGGGGFVSRLMKEVREKRGLSYSVYSYVAAGKQIGPFVAGLQTQKSQARLALDVMNLTIADFVKDGPTEVELSSAKQNLINGFPLRIDSNKKILDNVANIAWLGLPLDTLDTWTQKVQAVTLEQIKTAFQRHLDMNAMVTVVVGGTDAR